MKKFISAFTAVIAVIAILYSNVLPAMANVNNAQNYFDYTDGSKYYVYTEYSEDENCYVYRYDGGGIVTNWEFVGLKEGVDYDVYAMGEAHIAIRYIAEKKEFSDLNLTVNFDRWQTALYVQDITVYINGLRNYGDIDIDYDKTLDIHTYTYMGKGTLVGWEFPNLTEGVNYKVVGKGENSLTIRLINGQNEIPYLNVFVDYSKQSDAAAKELGNSSGEDVVPVSIKAVTQAVSNEEATVAPAENGAQNMVIICIAVGVCSAAVSGIIVFAVMKKKKNA